KAASGLLPSQARILASIDPEINEQTSPLPLHACIELNPGKRVSLRRGITTIGRDDTNDIFLDQPEIQSQRLVSGQHAYIRGDDVEYRIFDGSPSGRSSVNGTFVNNRRVPPEGQPLQDGDTIILAALDPGNPRPDIPGVAVLRFLRSCL
ncbi:MAG: FHA domain-containing protein, partial [Chloroflexota bacterium]